MGWTLRSFSILFFLNLLSCGSGSPASVLSSLEFSPNPAAVSDGLCVSTARITEIAGHSVSIISVEALFTDSAGQSARYVFDSDQLSLLLDSQSLPAHGVVNGSFSFDLGSEGLQTPSEGSVVAVGAGGETVTHFVGTLRCEGSS